MPLSVKDALEIGAFKECKLLGGAGGLNRIVNYISGMEIPTVRGWVSARQIVITTAYSIKNEPEKVLEIIRDLHVADASALCLKTRFIGEISEEVIELANKLNMPLIEIPDYIPFVNINGPLMKAIISDQNTQFIENNFFLDLIAGNVKGEEEARTRANNLNWPKLPTTILIFDIDAFEEIIRNKSEDEIFQLKESVYQMIRQIIFKNCGQAAIVQKSDSFSCILSDAVSKDTIGDAVVKVKSMVQEKLGLCLTAGACRGLNNYMEIKKNESNARDAITINRKSDLVRPVLFIDDAKVEQALLHMKDNALMLEYINSTVGKLEAFDKENNTQLVTTLEELIKVMGVRVKAAKNLFLHRNTLTQRIKKIEAIIECNLSRESELISLAIALKVKRLIK